MEVALAPAAGALPGVSHRIGSPAVLPFPQQPFDLRAKFLWPVDDECSSSLEPPGDLARHVPGVLHFSAQNQKTSGLHRRFSLKPFLTYPAKDSEKQASPSGQGI